MTDTVDGPRTAPPEPRAPADVPSVTGVASGSLGTGTALDDTQEYDVADWLDARGQAAANPASEPAPAAPAVPVAAPPSPEPMAAPVAPVAAPAAVAPARVPTVERSAVPEAAAAPVPAAGPAPARLPAPAPRRSGVGPREAGILAAILLVLVAAIALTNGAAENAGLGAPPFGADATFTAPAATGVANDDGDGGNDGGGGNGGGRGGGNGNGNGNGGGNGNGNGGGGND